MNEAGKTWPERLTSDKAPAQQNRLPAPYPYGRCSLPWFPRFTCGSGVDPL
jgi:hypothetical protein